MHRHITSERSERLLKRPVGRTLIELAVPMMIGLAAVILFNVVDMLYVGRLGAPQLAAMGFTFPVVFLIMTFTLGLGTGVTSVISRALGAGDRTEVRRLATHGLILANAVVVIVALAGLFSIGPLFRLMGAEPHPGRASSRRLRRRAPHHRASSGLHGAVVCGCGPAGHSDDRQQRNSRNR